MDSYDQHDIILYNLSDIYEDYAEDLCQHFECIEMTHYFYIARCISYNIIGFLIQKEGNVQLNMLEAVCEQYIAKSIAHCLTKHIMHFVVDSKEREGDKQKELYQIQTGSTRPKIFNNVHSSSIYRNGPHSKHIVIDIDETKQIRIQKRLLLGSDPYDKNDVIWCSLSDIYDNYAEDLCRHFESIEVTDYPYIARCISFIIISFPTQNEGNLQLIMLKVVCTQYAAKSIPQCLAKQIMHFAVNNEKRKEIEGSERSAGMCNGE